MNNASDGSGGISTIHPPQFNTFTTVVGPQIMTTLVTETEKSQVSTLEVIDQKNQHSQNTSTCEIPSSVATTHANENLVNTSLFVHSRNMATSPTNSVLPSSSSSQKMLLDSQLSKGYKSTRTFKVIIVGDAGVGKTCLSFRFCCGRFPEHTESTIGVDFRDRCCVIERELLRVQLWDTAGQERYRQSIIAHYYRNVNAVVFVYDVTNKTSFDSLRGWINECEKHGLTAEGDVPRILIGNKCDLLTENKVPMDIAQMFADRNNMALFETSAKSDSEADHVESIFLTLLHKLQQSKPMHVQTESERQAKEQKKLVLKASEAASLEESGWCC